MFDNLGFKKRDGAYFLDGWEADEPIEIHYLSAGRLWGFNTFEIGDPTPADVWFLVSWGAFGVCLGFGVGGGEAVDFNSSVRRVNLHLF